MLPAMDMAACGELAVPMDVMTHVVAVESARNPYAIGVVGGRLVRQPANLPEALATVRMLEQKGYNFSLGLAQVNRYNLGRYGLDSYEKAFHGCLNLQAGARILAECHGRSGGDWGKSFSCYYSGNFVTGYRHGYVQKIQASIAAAQGVAPIELVGQPTPVPAAAPSRATAAERVQARVVADVAGAADIPPDPALVRVVPASAGAMARQEAVHAADAMLANVVQRRMGAGGSGSSAILAEPAAAERAVPVSPGVLGTRPDDASGLVGTPPRAAPSGGAVMLRPWNDRDKPVAGPAVPVAAPGSGRDSAFVF